MEFEDDLHSFRVRRIMQLNRLAVAAARRNAPGAKMVRRMLWPVWIAGLIFAATVACEIGYALFFLAVN
jgi:predicted anti-sigma-YlaC factor YlaD